jgi:MFS family permease
MDSERRKGGNPIWAFLIGLIFATVLLGYYLTRFVTWWQSCLVVNALYGLLLFELGWRDTLRFRQVDEERDKLFPAYRRLDVKNWRNRKWMFYPGAMTLMPIRALVSLGSFAVCCVILHIVMLGHDMNKPTTGPRDFLRVKMF